MFEIVSIEFPLAGGTVDRCFGAGRLGADVLCLVMFWASSGRAWRCVKVRVSARRFEGMFLSTVASRGAKNRSISRMGMAGVVRTPPPRSHRRGSREGIRSEV